MKSFIKHIKIQRGLTLIELIFVFTILAVVFAIIPQFSISFTRVNLVNTARLEIQRSARNSLELINRQLRQAFATSVILDRLDADQPAYSRIRFDKINSKAYEFYQEGQFLFMIVDGGVTRKIAENLKNIGFYYPKTFNPNLISVSVTFEKRTFDGGTKALHTTIENVSIMN